MGEHFEMITAVVLIIGLAVGISYPFYQGTSTGIVTEKILNGSYHIEVDNTTIYSTSLELYAKLNIGDRITFDYSDALMFPDRYMIEATKIE